MPSDDKTTMAGAMHASLCLLAERWLRSQGCGIVFRDNFRALTHSSEQPDAIGWRWDASILIECKTCRQDFLADKRKHFRADPSKGVGTDPLPDEEGLQMSPDALRALSASGEVLMIFSPPRHQRPRQGQAPSRRHRMFEGQRGLCHLCGEAMLLEVAQDHPEFATYDHLLPASAGGTKAASNIRLAHRRCNMARGNAPIEELQL